MTHLLLLLLLFLSLTPHLCNSKPPWMRIQAAYWYSGSELPISDINSALFTHLFCAFAFINPSSFELHINATNEPSFSGFTTTVKRRNPSIVSLLSVWAGGKDSSVFSSMINQFAHRRSFIQSSIRAARLRGFHGLELSGVAPRTGINTTNLGTLLGEWREAAAAEANNSAKPQLLLVMSGYHFPAHGTVFYPIESIKRNLDWIHVVAFDYNVPTEENFTAPHAALYGSKWTNTDSVIKEWLRKGLPARMIVLGLAYHGFAWKLANPGDNAIGAPSSGPAVTIDGSMGYKYIKSFIRNYGYGASASYNSSYVMSVFVVGSTWINFDDVEAIRAKVSYARENNLLGYTVFQLSNDDNWVLSRAAKGSDNDIQKKLRLFAPILLTVAVVSLLLCAIACCYLRRKSRKLKGIICTIRRSLSKLKMKISATDIMDTSAPNLKAYSFGIIKLATNNFSSKNKLGEGGFGPVFKGKLPTGKEIAVKRLSKTSNQGVEEFRNEVTLTSRLQHVNLVRVLGYCTEREEKMLIYEYMPNKSLDFYLYDPLKQQELNWKKRVHIIEGVTQGLLYLQEYSNFTVIHRDIKASNILLDEEMTPKIADFGMARLFKKDELEANTGRIVGTYGYVPPEYVRKGIYSTKYDVYSFGVLLLQIISGKRSTSYYGPYENLTLLEYAYELWQENEGMEFIDPSLLHDDDSSPSSSTSWKLMRCLQVALLCVQENPLDRPSMLEVSCLVKNEAVGIPTPKRPAFSTNRDGDVDCLQRNVVVYSVDNATITQVVPR